MISRPFWINRIEQAWREAPIAWMSGVRRSGKTTLAESLGAERTLYVNCDLPSVEELVRDPQIFFRSCTKPVVVLEHLQAHFAGTPAMYWRDKAGHEVDFVLPIRRDSVDAIECKWDPTAFDGTALRAFRNVHPGGRNYLVCPGAELPLVKRFGDLVITVCTPSELRPGAM